MKRSNWASIFLRTLSRLIRIQTLRIVLATLRNTCSVILLPTLKRIHVFFIDIIFKWFAIIYCVTWNWKHNFIVFESTILCYLTRYSTQGVVIYGKKYSITNDTIAFCVSRVYLHNTFRKYFALSLGNMRIVILRTR